MSQWDKLITEILRANPNLRFDQLYKALVKIGYAANQPKGGSSHYTFRKSGYMPITIPRQTPINRAYIELVAEVVRAYLEGENNE